MRPGLRRFRTGMNARRPLSVRIVAVRPELRYQVQEPPNSKDVASTKQTTNKENKRMEALMIMITAVMVMYGIGFAAFKLIERLEND